MLEVGASIESRVPKRVGPHGSALEGLDEAEAVKAACGTRRSL